MGDQLFLKPLLDASELGERVCQAGIGGKCPRLREEEGRVSKRSLVAEMPLQTGHRQQRQRERRQPQAPPQPQPPLLPPPPPPHRGCQLPRLPKKKHRRRPSKKKRRWKPYFKLTWEEKKKLDERESVRAAKTRAEMFAKGFTVAPYNTTQFLMDEHDREEPDLNPGFCPTAANHRRSAGKVDADSSGEDDELLLEEEEQESGSDGMGGSGSEFLQRDFCETYERYHAETLQNMSKQELIREYLELEKCLSRLEDEKNRLRRRLEATDRQKGLELGLEPKLQPELRGEEEEEEGEKEGVHRQVERLRAENHRLEKENELLCRRENERRVGEEEEEKEEEEKEEESCWGSGSVK